MGELFHLEKSSLMRLFYGLGRNASAAEDLLQNTFLALWRYRRNYRGDGNASAYLYRVAINQWRRYIAKERRGRDTLREVAPRRIEELVEEPDDPVAREETRAAVRRAIDSLPDPQREAFLLHRFQGLSCPQIAASVDKPVKTIESRLRLALEKLTEKLQKREKLR